MLLLCSFVWAGCLTKGGGEPYGYIRLLFVFLFAMIVDMRFNANNPMDHASWWMFI
ncbi:protein of unknown function [Cupriavidus taiwanensis]|uniref:Uncharacterized protein n=1 Tax=Cupriavidus taiwanensis TaxID=164546 RepID=A0A375I9U1_9BURK|nr:protein of unknown function [Cupriavidus taiwanensis]